jgi:hypothetical protein
MNVVGVQLGQKAQQIVVQGQAALIVTGDKRCHMFREPLVMEAVQIHPRILCGQHHFFFQCEMSQGELRQLAQK